MSKNEKHKRAFLVWLAIYPLITMVFYLAGDLLMQLPVAVRTLVLTGSVVPVVFYWVLPFYHRLFKQWLK